MNRVAIRASVLSLFLSALAGASALVACNEIAGIGAPILESEGGTADGGADGSPIVTDGGSDATIRDAGPGPGNDGGPILEDGGAPDVIVPDGATCVGTCTLAQTRCADGGVETCKADSSGCGAWSETQTCGAHQACGAAGDAGVVACNCISTPCTQNGSACQDGATLLTCATDGNNCVYVSQTTTCTSPQTCSGKSPNAACSTTCSDSCSAGDTACVSGKIETCAQGSNGCLSYGAAAACPSFRQTCTGAAGSATCTCNPDAVCVGATSYCSSSSVISCAQDSAACWYESSTQTCQNGTCTGSPGAATCCTNACTINATQCGANGQVETCVTQANGCTGWSAPAVCAAGKVCNASACVAGCFIGGSYVAPGAANPTNGCQTCVPGTSTSAYTSPSNLGTACSSGVGACARSGTYVCSGSSVVCNATAGTPGGYSATAAPNGSWDWNCDGTVELEYPLCPANAPGGGTCGGSDQICASVPQTTCGAAFASSGEIFYCCNENGAPVACCNDDNPGWGPTGATCIPATQKCE